MKCNNHLGNNSSATNCNVVSTIAIVCALKMLSILVRASEDVLIEDENQSESFLNECKDMEHNFQLNITR